MYKWFKKGDIIRIEKGMSIYTEIPSKYTTKYYFTNESSGKTFTVGDVFRNIPISKEDLVNEFLQHVEHFDYFHGFKISKESTNNILTFLDSLNLDFEPSFLDTSIFIGDYVVDHCFVGSESTDIERQSKDFVCIKLDNPSIKVCLLQNKDLMENFPNVLVKESN